VPLVCDATALVALGGITSISLLERLDAEVVISPWIKERELRRFSQQVDAGIEAGWLRVQEPSVTEVRNLINAVSRSFDLDQGEAETLVIASHQGGRPTTVVIDEGEAFVFVERLLIGRDAVKSWTLVCLADLLHELEGQGIIDSAIDTMQRLLDEGLYRWSPAVWAHYSRRRDQRGMILVPRTPSQAR
jgi:predicted nucleic acid-binding protein